jgi:lysophospholipase L1-like esterase
MLAARRVLGILSLGALVFGVGLTACSNVVYPLNDVAFMGDSITQYWSLPVINLGVGGETTTQMLARFQPEVVGHGYRAVVILGGINDINHQKTAEEVMANIKQMAKIAQDAQIDVVLCELTPDFRYNSAHDPEIRQLNSMIVQLAVAEHYTLVDYYDPMAGHPEYFKDELHPNAAGYAVMEQVLLPELDFLLKK